MHFDFDPGSPTIWVFLATIIFLVAMMYFGIHKKIASALDARAQKITDELDEARRLREEAQTLLASYHRKQKEAETLAEEIVSQARRDAENMAIQARKDLAERLDRRAQLAEDKIANAEVQALAEVRARAADMAIAAAEKIIRENMSAANHKTLVASGIKQIGKSLN
ncbi:F0F1 ATP synthase subunit B family protein [Robiginitomaculum antarcticum]|uniref:F0F1 ATP synthase subunit B family protein n=1 Tax=Robiginitomaculum antarcticum TaxID=437507 RepID=UPI00037C1561|nr:hypothetical protein [Robiginitomaculum antarcticum]